MRKTMRSMGSRDKGTQNRRMHLIGQVPVPWTIATTETELKDTLY